MRALLKKDFIASRYIYIISILVVGIVLCFFSMYSFESILFIYLFGTFIIPLTANKFTSTDEMRRNYDTIINSFPVRRNNVVLSKFIYYLISYILTSVILLAVVVIVRRFNQEELTMIYMVQSLSFIYYCLIIGITNLVYYRYDYGVATKYSLMIIMSVIYIPMILFGIIGRINPSLKIKISNYLLEGINNRFYLGTAIILVGIVIYILFMGLSISGYRKRDL